MTDRYRIVFSGQLSYGYTEKEARQTLAKRFKFTTAQLDRLFSPPDLTLKKGLDEEQARALVSKLRDAGIHCKWMPENEPTCPPTKTPVSPQTTPIKKEAPVTNATSPASTTLVCPKCQTEQPTGDSCPHCGIIFERYRQRQERIARGEIGPNASSAVDTKKASSEDFFDRHPEAPFLIKAAITIALILSLTTYLPGLVALLLFLFPLLGLLYIRFKASAEDIPMGQIVREHFTLMPIMYTEEARKQEGVAWVTYGLILLNIFIFYGYELQVDPRIIGDYLMFVPQKATALTVSTSLLTHMFLHASNGHLWGNMIALWIFGTVIEKRIGPGRFITFYLLTGVVAAVVSLAIIYFSRGVVLNGLGASGAIAGIMGLFAVRCYFKSMVFPIPILGLFSLIFPLSLKVRLNSLVLIGLFFLKDLVGGMGQVLGTNSNHINHWAHLGGMMMGMGLAYLFKLGSEAVHESYLEQGLKQTTGGQLSGAGQAALRQVLEREPENIEAMRALAQQVSKYAAVPEGEELYRRAIGLLLQQRPQEAPELFNEYYERYFKGVEPAQMYRLAGLFQQNHDLLTASRLLTMLGDDPNASLAQCEKALLRNGIILRRMGETEAARNCYLRLLDICPDTPYVEQVRTALQTL